MGWSCGALAHLGASIGPRGGQWGGWCGRSGPARGRSVFMFPFWGQARIWPDTAIFVEFSIPRPWEPPVSASRTSLGPRGGARHACVSHRAVGGPHPLIVPHSRFLAVPQPFLGNLAHLARNGSIVTVLRHGKPPKSPSRAVRWR